MSRILHRRRHRALQRSNPAVVPGSTERVEVSPPRPPLAEENHFETLLCLKYGRLYGVISSQAYETGKVDLLSRI